MVCRKILDRPGDLATYRTAESVTPKALAANLQLRQVLDVLVALEALPMQDLPSLAVRLR